MGGGGCFVPKPLCADGSCVTPGSLEKSCKYGSTSQEEELRFRLARIQWKVFQGDQPHREAILYASPPG